MCGGLFPHPQPQVSNGISSPSGLMADLIQNGQQWVISQLSLQANSAAIGVMLNSAERLIQFMGKPRCHLTENTQALSLFQRTFPDPKLLVKLLQLLAAAAHQKSYPDMIGSEQ